MTTFGGPLDYWILKRFFPRDIESSSSRPKHLEPYELRIVKAVGREKWSQWKDGTIVDFGCGSGDGAIELALSGARRVIGIDIRPELINAAEQRAIGAGVEEHCTFLLNPPKFPVDTIVSIDAFEHFLDPAAVLKSMSTILADNGRVIASFGPTWYHPRGGHLFSVFPWAHLILSEQGLCRWRRDFRKDGATRFAEVEGGLNRMTIRRFKKLVDDSPLKFEKLECRPIHALRFLHCRWTREFLTSITECILVKR